MLACAALALSPFGARAQSGGCLIDVERELAVCPADGDATLAAWIERRMGPDYQLQDARPDGGGISAANMPPVPGVGYAIADRAGRGYILWASEFPLLSIESSDAIVDDPKVAGRLTLGLPDEDAVDVEIGVEWRGFAALYYDKKNYDLEVEDGDVEIPGLRSDDDWVLNGMPDEPQRIRSFLAQQLWLDMARRPASFSDEAVMGAGARYVEVAVDGDYRGIYLASEQIDRKQLDLSRPGGGGQGHGELFKAAFWAGATQWATAPDYDNDAEDYDRWEQKFPDPDDFGNDYSGLHESLLHASATSDSALVAGITRHFDLPNLVDYFLWVNVATARDNRGTNTYAARNATDGPWAIIPWDMDATFGSEWNGTYTPDGDWIMGNYLIHRLLESEWPGFREAAAERYFELRESLITVDELRSRADAAHARLGAFGADARERARWPQYGYESTSDSVVAAFAVRLDLLDGYLGPYVVDEVTPAPGDTTDADSPPADTADTSAGDDPTRRSLVLSPNPTSGRAALTLPEDLGGELSATVVDLSGRISRRLRVRAGRNELDFTSLSAGVYTLQVDGFAPVRILLGSRR